ncbi:hypothetical protein [Qipengyuania spongiae]|uniref:DUF4175 domain-containing protein n=1 Tax=Qipengyuania spongiae TaxID=2909673 RepID=A0ABY5SV40_9SPHN|nr:hypothetical protein [Qipengyuania spongiae]UVI38428.1 hypothetical protein L1F33_09155 [Qipengyuania spongiae]
MRHYRLPAPRGMLRTLLVPAILLVVSLAGLWLALTDDGAADWLAALLLSLPLFAIAHAWSRSAPAPSRKPRSRNLG